MTSTAAGEDKKVVLERIAKLLADFPPDRLPDEEFLGAQFDMGLAYVHFPLGFGGLGLSRDLEPLIVTRLTEAGAPITTGRSVGHLAAPTIMAFGTEEQKRRYLRPLFTCEEVWCQLFSEPGAGSDLAGLSTRAIRDGDDWIINGQKVWTTLAHAARFAMLLARTDPDVEKHKGITYFIADMRAPGVEVRPLRQMTGDATFNEVYLTDVRIPDSQRLGAVGEGWRAVNTTLMNERVAFMSHTIARRGSGPIGQAVDLWKSRGSHDVVLRERLMRFWVSAEVNRLTGLRAATNLAAGNPGPEGSIGKLAYAELAQDIYDFCMDLLGPEAMLYDTYQMRRPTDVSMVKDDPPARMFLRSRSNSISGGTSEIMRNILGERVLGLPGDVRADKGIPWSQVPRS